MNVHKTDLVADHTATRGEVGIEMTEEETIDMTETTGKLIINFRRDRDRDYRDKDRNRDNDRDRNKHEKRRRRSRS